MPKKPTSRTTNVPATPAEEDSSPQSHDAISLDEVAKQLNINPTEPPLRSEIARRVVKMFVVMNLAVLMGLALAMFGDFVTLWGHIYGPDDRLVTSAVLMRLIEAVAAQAGVFALIIARGLFPAAGMSGGEPTNPSKSVAGPWPKRAANDSDSSATGQPRKKPA